MPGPVSVMVPLRLAGPGGSPASGPAGGLSGGHG